MKRILLLLIATSFVMVACTGNKTVEVVLKKYEDGKPQDVMVYRIERGDSIPIIEKKFHPNGEKYIEGYLKLGMRDSVWCSWYPNGNMWSQINYVGGREEGVYKTFHENGSPYIIGEYKNGKECGVWSFTSSTGEVLKVYDFNKKEDIVK